MLKTLARFVTYRGVQFSDKTILSEGANYSFYTLENFSFFFVETESTDTPFKLRHGYVSGFTKNNWRKIQMTFSVVAYDEKERWERIKEVNSIFEPPDNPNRTDRQGFYPLEFMMPDGGIRTCNARCIARPQEAEYETENIIQFEVELICEGWSYLYWKTQFQITDRNYVPWVSFWESFAFPFGEYPSGQINYTWVSVAPVKCTIVALQDTATTGSIQVLSIRDTTYTRMFFNVNMNLWDVLIIDPQNYVVTLNGADITWDLDLSFGNNFPKLASGSVNQQLVVNTGRPTQTIEVTWEYRNTWY